MLELWVDFNNTDGKGNVVTARKFAVHDHHLGERVVVGDGGGDICDATIVEMNETTIVVSLTPGTFRCDDVEHRTAAPA